VVRERRKRVEVRGWRQKAKCQSSKFEIPVEAEKRALSTNYIFSITTPRQPERVQTQFWVEGGVSTRMLEKIS
jgi:hypothetical protein